MTTTAKVLVHVLGEQPRYEYPNGSTHYVMLIVPHPLW